ncbi:uncharacterized protein LOC131954149 [Physella acuta]|uniref:uncharacterized protein LOC131954149 n=1 Tax=Physella acuta TaxID=109671 RepID=UPI0027DB84CF|nr:uncharacterized protein LOC131954149 [Physella acuta]
MSTERLLRFIFMYSSLSLACSSDDNFKWFDVMGEHYFTDVHQPHVTFREAIEICSSHGGSVVEHSDKENMVIISDYISIPMWAKYPGSRCSVFEHTDGSAFMYDYSDDSEFILRIVPMKCQEQFPFVCKKGIVPRFNQSIAEVLNSLDNLDQRTYKCDVMNLFYRGDCLVTIETPLPYDAASKVCSSAGGFMMQASDNVDYTLLDYELEARNFTGEIWVEISSLLDKEITDETYDWSPFSFNQECKSYSKGSVKRTSCDSSLPFVCRIPVKEMYNSTNQTDHLRHHHHTHHKCPGHQIRYLDRCYKIHSEHYYSWHHAKDYCKKHKMGLMIIHSYEEFQFVRTHIGNISNIWVGLYTTKTGQLKSLDHHSWNLTMELAEVSDVNETHTRECGAFDNVKGQLSFHDCKLKWNFICTGKLREKHHEKKNMLIVAIVGGVLATAIIVGLLAVIVYKRRRTILTGRLYINSRFTKLMEEH